MSEFDQIRPADVGAAITRAEQAMSEFGVLTEARTIRFQRVLPGPIERVWAFLTESEQRGRWLASGPMELRVGGRVELNFRHAELCACPEAAPAKYRKFEQGVTNRGHITRCDPPHLLSFTWDEESGVDSEVTFELSPRDDEVLLVLTHRRLGDRAMRLGVATGWHTHLGVLADDLTGRERRPFWSRFAALESEYQSRLAVE
jgi:uncharacterized protein YndB with AHSA1/START domain